MAHLPEEFIDGLIDKIDIVDVISDYVSLKRSGNKYIGLCPFHNEKTPSFTVDGDKQLFYCFGCHVGGNVIGFLEKKESLTFVETVEFLAQRANVQLPQGTDMFKPAVSKELKNRVFEANKAAARYYFNMLFEPQGVEGREYFESRGITENIIKRFGLGFAPDSRDGLIKHLKSLGFVEDELVSAGLAARNEYGVRDFFRMRVMFPIISPMGNVLGFGGRVLDKSLPKYLNTSDTPVFNKRKNLYALNILKKNGGRRAIIAEGYMDVIALNMGGFPYGVASLGTAVTREQVKLLQRSAQELFVCYDGDKAGISATHKVIDIMTEEKLKPKIISLPVGVDPDEYIKANGPEAFAQMMEKAVSAIDYLLDEALEKFDMAAEQGRADYAKEGAAIVGKYALDSIEVEMHLKRIHRESGFSMDALYDCMGGKAPSDRQRALQKEPVLQKKTDCVIECAVLASIIEYPELISKAKQNLKTEYFSEVYRDIFEYICQSGKTTVNELLMNFDGDEKKCAAVSAICIDKAVFGDPQEFFNDCCIRLKGEALQQKRIALKQRLDELITQGGAGSEDMMAAAQEITIIDLEIKNLRSQI